MAVHPLFLAWLFLMALTGSVGALASLEGGKPGFLAFVLVGALTIIKARVILSRYLRLGPGPGFLPAFTVVAVAIMAISVLALKVEIPPLKLPRPGAASSSAGPRSPPRPAQPTR